jgi:hypothetical protein
VLRGEVADSAAEGEAGNAGRADHASGSDEAERLRRRVEVEPGGAARGPRDPRVAVYVDPAHQREVDHEPAVQDAVSGGVVPAAAHRHLQRPRAREVEGGGNVSGVEAAHDHRRSAVDETVEAAARSVVDGVGPGHHGAGDGPAQLGQARIGKSGRLSLFTHRTPSLGGCPPGG